MTQFLVKYNTLDNGCEIIYEIFINMRVDWSSIC